MQFCCKIMKMVQNITTEVRYFFLKKPGSHLWVIGARRVTRSKCRTENTQILVDTVKNFGTDVTSRSGFVQSCIIQWFTWLLELVYSFVSRKEYKVLRVGFAFFLGLIVLETHTDICQTKRVSKPLNSQLSVYTGWFYRRGPYFGSLCYRSLLKKSSYECVNG